MNGDGTRFFLEKLWSVAGRASSVASYFSPTVMFVIFAVGPKFITPPRPLRVGLTSSVLGSQPASVGNLGVEPLYGRTARASTSALTRNWSRPAEAARDAEPTRTSVFPARARWQHGQVSNRAVTGDNYSGRISSLPRRLRLRLQQGLCLDPEFWGQKYTVALKNAL